MIYQWYKVEKLINNVEFYFSDQIIGKYFAREKLKLK